VIWAYSIAQSRGFNIYVDDDSDDTDFALVPMVDMMNHDSASTSDIRMSFEGDSVVVTANGEYPKGSDFVGRYVKTTNTMASWLASYGFVNPKSMYQGLRIEYHHLMKTADFTEAHQTSLMQALKGAGCEQGAWKDKPFALTVNGFSPGYLLCMRLSLLSPEDYASLISGGISMHMDAPFSKENERKTIGTLSNQIRRLLAVYGTTLAEDQAALDSLEDFDDVNMRNIITLRQREKALYFHGLRTLETMAATSEIDKSEL